MRKFMFLIFVILVYSVQWPFRGPAAAFYAKSQFEAPTPGTIITMQNWRQYREYMSDGVQALFEGKYFWKMPANVEMNVGPTVIDPLPKNYMAATEKYSGNVAIR